MFSLVRLKFHIIPPWLHKCFIITTNHYHHYHHHVDGYYQWESTIVVVAAEIEERERKCKQQDFCYTLHTPSTMPKCHHQKHQSLFRGAHCLRLFIDGWRARFWNSLGHGNSSSSSSSSNQLIGTIRRSCGTRKKQKKEEEEATAMLFV